MGDEPATEAPPQDCTWLNCTLESEHEGDHNLPAPNAEEIAEARAAQHQRITSEVVTRIAEEARRAPVGHVYMPTLGWAVREPGQQDPQKRDGDLVQPPWMPSFGMYASAHATDGLMFYFVIVQLPDGSQGIIRHTPELRCVQMVPPQPPIQQGA